MAKKETTISVPQLSSLIILLANISDKLTEQNELLTKLCENTNKNK
jgi:hypothetical protein